MNFVFDNGVAAGWEGNNHWQKALGTNEESSSSYLPVAIDNRVLGVLCLVHVSSEQISAEQKKVVDSLLNHAAVILQRERLMKAEANAQALVEADKLKTALLSMVSHDFRSP